jgi:hypothetical protein
LENIWPLGFLLSVFQDLSSTKLNHQKIRKTPIIDGTQIFNFKGKTNKSRLDLCDYCLFNGDFLGPHKLFLILAFIGSLVSCQDKSKSQVPNGNLNESERPTTISFFKLTDTQPSLVSTTECSEGETITLPARSDVASHFSATVGDKVFSGWCNDASDCSSLSDLDFQGRSQIICMNEDIQLYALLLDATPNWQDAQGVDLVIPNSVTSIGNDSFYNKQLTGVVIPDSVTSIGSYAFMTNQITMVVIPNSVTSIGIYAFESNLLTNLLIPNSVTSIEDGAFTANKLTSVVIPSSVISIGEAAFMTNLLTSVVIPNSVTSIGSYAFHSNLLTSLVISDSLTSIGIYAFRNNKLTSVVIPDSLTSIGSNIFRDNLLTSIVIPGNVTILSTSMGTYGAAFKTVYDNLTTGGAGSYTYDVGQGWIKQLP